MRRVLRFLRVVIPRISVGLLLAQLAFVIGITGWESLRKKHRKLRRFPYSPAKPAAVDQDEVTVYTFGEELYRDMLAATDDARKVVNFETYIWKSDEVREAFKGTLGRAAARGVEANVIWDDFANLVVPRRFFTMPEDVLALRHPALPKPWSPRSWGCDHRKLLIVDREKGFIGGYNIGRLHMQQWRDIYARVIGPGAAELENAFVNFWNQSADKQGLPRLSNDQQRRWNFPLKVHRNVPRIQIYLIRNMYLGAIDRATECIWLTHAYPIPGDNLVATLWDAVKRGTDVRTIVPDRSNHAMTDQLSRGFYADLSNSDVRLFLYQGAMMYSKAAVINGIWPTIRTANLDCLSLWGSYEANLEITDRDVASHMEHVSSVDEGSTVELTVGAWLRRPRWRKFAESLLSPWRPLF